MGTVVKGWEAWVENYSAECFSLSSRNKNWQISQEKWQQQTLESSFQAPSKTASSIFILNFRCRLFHLFIFDEILNHQHMLSCTLENYRMKFSPHMNLALFHFFCSSHSLVRLYLNDIIFRQFTSSYVCRFYKRK